MFLSLQRYTLYLLNTCPRVFTSLMYLVIFLFGVINYQKLMAAPQTPSQALPKMFQKPPGLDYYQFKKQDKVVPQLPEIEIKQQEDVGIVIRLSSIIILAPKNFFSLALPFTTSKENVELALISSSSLRNVPVIS